MEQSFGVRLPDEVATVAAAGVPPYRGKGRARPAEPALLDTGGERAAGLLAEEWQAVTWRGGSKGPLQKQFAARGVCRATGTPANPQRLSPGPEGWLVIER